MGINNVGIIIKGKLMLEQRMHSFFMCIDKKKKDLTILDHAYFGKLSSNDPKMFMEKISKMENLEFFTIGAAYSGRANQRSYIKVSKPVSNMRKREKKGLKNKVLQKAY